MRYKETENCPKCGGFRYGLGNGMMAKCEGCGYQECPNCGERLTDNYCLGCHIHMAPENCHVIGECSECEDRWDLIRIERLV